MASVLAISAGAYHAWLVYEERELAATAADALDRCDASASHPRDPSRFASGVTDDQMAPGRATAACEAATTLNPSVPRAWFQLGRTYWIARRDAEAFGSFERAWSEGYFPAAKYIGDAYLTGRGLPPDKTQSSATAKDYYKAACEKNFDDACIALDDIFDPSVYQNPDLISDIYNGPIDHQKHRNTAMCSYIGGFIQRMDGEEMFFIDQECKPGVKFSASIVSQFWGIGCVLSKDTGPTAIDGINAWQQGDRDAVLLQKKHTCGGDIAKRTFKNIDDYVREILSGRAFLHPQTPRTSTTPQAPTDPSTQSRAYQDGARHRDEWEQWFSNLSGDAREGAEFWAGARNDRSRPRPPSCISGKGQTSVAYKQACDYAQAFLKMVDDRARGRSGQPVDEEYRRGWNYK